jgi:hypothetical protein
MVIDMECNIDMNMQHGHGHAEWIWLCSMDLDSAHAWMHECRNADEKLSPASLVYIAWSGISIPWSFQYRWSRINPLVPSSGAN